MSFAKNTICLALSSILLSAGATAAFAQAGGGDVPTNAKKQGEKENPGSTGGSGSTGAGGASSSSSDSKGTAPGGSSGGAAGKN